MTKDYLVVLDACVLVSAGLRDTLLRLAESPRLYVPKWSEDIIEEMARTLRERDRLRSGLVELGYCPAPSVANFLFFDSREDATELASRLLPHGVIVKPWREAGYAQHVRVSVGLPQANDQFLEVLEKVAAMS